MGSNVRYVVLHNCKPYMFNSPMLLMELCAAEHGSQIYSVQRWVGFFPRSFCLFFVEACKYWLMSQWVSPMYLTFLHTTLNSKGLICFCKYVFLLYQQFYFMFQYAGVLVILNKYPCSTAHGHLSLKSNVLCAFDCQLCL